jgi:hypothetical protein
MMHPYRTSISDEPRARRSVDWDDRVLAALMIAVGGIRVGIAIGTAESFGAEPSIAAVMIALGALLLCWRH